MAEIEGHAFICYVREDAIHADRVMALLTEAEIPVWRDTENLWPGEDWRERIREAITDGAFAFIPIFSSTSVAKGVSGQNEELYLAAEEMRRRQPGAPWIIPVRTDACALPKLRLGGDRTLDSIQRADLFGVDGDRQADRFVESVRRIIAVPAVRDARGGAAPPTDATGGLSPPTSPADLRPRRERELKEALRDVRGDIRLYDLVVPLASAVHDALADQTRYPTEGSVTVLEGASQIDRYWIDLGGLLDDLIVGGAWSLEEHSSIWTDVTERIARAHSQRSGNVARLALRWFPLLPVVYAGGLAASVRSNYSFVRAVALDATVRELEGRVPVCARANAWQPFADFPLVAQAIALQASGEVIDDEVVAALQNGQRGKRYTPVSDHLHDRLRNSFRWLVPDDGDYSEMFDRFEILLGVLMADLRVQAYPSDGERWTGPWIGEPYTGRFTWRDRHAEVAERVEVRYAREAESAGERWSPLASGLFGGSWDRAKTALEHFLETAARARSQRW